MRFGRASLVAGLTLFAIATRADAWGPGAHLYVARSVLGESQGDGLFASMLPDMFGFASDSAVKSAVQRLTHREFARLAPSAFAAGFATHNGDWGADYYSHAYWDPTAPDTYLTSRMKQFASEFGYSVNDAENVIEGVVDYLIRRDQGAAWGTFVEQAADAVGGLHERALVDAFAGPLSERVPGLSQENAASAIRTMFQQFRMVTRVYGQQLALNDDAFIRDTLISGFAQYFDVDQATAEGYMARAEELCWDYRDELDSIAKTVSVEIAASPYALPVGHGPSVLLTIMLTAGCAILLRRGPRCSAPSA